MNTALDQEAVKAVEAVKQALLDLQVYGTTHPVDDVMGQSLDALVAAGALSPRTSAFIASHQVRFYGFRTRPIRADIPVLEVLLAERAAPLRLVGFRDGHVQVLAADEQGDAQRNSSASIGQPPAEHPSVRSVPGGGLEMLCAQCRKLLSRAVSDQDPGVPSLAELIASGAVLVPNFGCFCNQECATRYEQARGEKLFNRNAAGEVQYYS